MSVKKDNDGNSCATPPLCNETSGGIYVISQMKSVLYIYIYITVQGKFAGSATLGLILPLQADLLQ